MFKTLAFCQRGCKNNTLFGFFKPYFEMSSKRTFLDEVRIFSINIRKSCISSIICILLP